MVQVEHRKHRRALNSLCSEAEKIIPFRGFSWESQSLLPCTVHSVPVAQRLCFPEERWAGGRWQRATLFQFLLLLGMGAGKEGREAELSGAMQAGWGTILCCGSPRGVTASSWHRRYPGAELCWWGAANPVPLALTSASPAHSHCLCGSSSARGTASHW